ncbi:hypothetical protein [Amycolatopsis australiensis]|uniref:Uncharacterized protein n=1 Tax=Amycolatopsis australiensis TaxID=546364 RepID=A0A1K1SVL7_9PSEU|nr:hypothetical protein [Amycolatopsis australiensis]SFW88440.1 hypothetical protein SAMN04489730_6959 [Amycolatopsis australiensis]
MMVLAADVRSWLDANLAWGDQSVRRLILLAAIVGGIGLLVGTRGNFTRAIKYGVIAAIFLGILLNLDGVAGMFGAWFTH